MSAKKGGLSWLACCLICRDEYRLTNLIRRRTAEGHLTNTHELACERGLPLGLIGDNAYRSLPRYQSACLDCGTTIRAASKRCRACANAENWVVNPELRLSPDKARTLTDVEAAWMGAMVEAEGSVIMSATRRDGKKWPYRSVMVCNTDIEIISACFRLVGAGSIAYREPRTEPNRPYSRKPLFIWRLNGKKTVESFLRQIAPYLTSKRERALASIYE